MSRTPTTCVFVSMCCPHFQDKRDLLLAVAEELAAKGCRVIVVVAGRRPCSHINRLEGDLSACLHWFEELKRRAHALDVDAVEVVGEDRELEALTDETWQRLADQNQLAWQGHRLDVIVGASVLRHRSSAVVPADNDRIQLSYEKDALRHLLYYKGILEKHQPQVGLYFGGQFHQDRTALLACRRANVVTYAIESSFVPGVIYCDRSGICGNRGEISSQSLLHETDSRVLSQEELTAVESLMTRSFQLPDMKNVEKERDRVRQRLQIPKTERMIVFLCQVPYDASLAMDSGEFGDQQRTVFAVHEVVSMMAGTLLAIRPHPKSVREPDRMIDLAKNLGVRILGPRGHDESLFATLCAADVAVTVSSQAGLQAAWLGVPVVTLGHPFYGRKGFTIDVGGRGEFLAAGIRAGLDTARGCHRSAVASYISVLSKFMLEGQQVLPLANLIRSTVA